MIYSIREGNFEKLGGIPKPGGVTFTFSGEREDVCVVVLIHRESGEQTRLEIPEEFRIGSLCSVEISGIEASDYVYYYEINGRKVMDPYARRVTGRELWNDGARADESYEVYAGFAGDGFDWKGDRSPEISGHEMFMYKLHVRGYTMEAGGKQPGTFRALMNKISYLKRLGVTTVELMPMYEFEELPIPEPVALPEYVNWKDREQDRIRPAQRKAEGPLNYWGYGPGNYFAVKASYAAEPEHADTEFKTLVRRLHESGMECVMEMFFPEESNHNMILDALRFWVREYHVDGFHLLGPSIPTTAIVQDSLLSRTKIFCVEFPPEVTGSVRKCRNLFVYKDEYMYPARKVLNHLNGNMRDFVDQQRKQSATLGYVNYIAGSNGFTLADLFMYNYKHNEANGEDNRDGNDWNFSNNYGCEGPTRRRYINALRRLKWYNSMLLVFMAQGVPLLVAGDEFCNSQNGNNNAYCQDNPVGWVNWKNENSHRKELQFLKKLVEFRREHPILSCEHPFQFCDYRSLGAPDLSFHGENAWLIEPNPGRLCLGMMYCGAYSEDEERNEDVYVAYNFYAAESNVALPNIGPDKSWYLVMDSDNETPYCEEPIRQEALMQMSPQSVRVLVSRREEHTEKRRRRRA